MALAYLPFVTSVKCLDCKTDFLNLVTCYVLIKFIWIINIPVLTHALKFAGTTTMLTMQKLEESAQQK